MNPSVMFEQPDTGKLFEEIDRYLGAVDLFRVSGCEPTWRPEVHSETTQPVAPLAVQRLPSDIRLH